MCKFSKEISVDTTLHCPSVRHISSLILYLAGLGGYCFCWFCQRVVSLNPIAGDRFSAKSVKGQKFAVSAMTAKQPFSRTFPLTYIGGWASQRSRGSFRGGSPPRRHNTLRSTRLVGLGGKLEMAKTCFVILCPGREKLTIGKAAW